MFLTIEPAWPNSCQIRAAALLWGAAKAETSRANITYPPIRSCLSYGTGEGSIMVSVSDKQAGQEGQDTDRLWHPGEKNTGSEKKCRGRPEVRSAAEFTYKLQPEAEQFRGHLALRSRCNRNALSKWHIQQTVKVEIGRTWGVTQSNKGHLLRRVCVSFLLCSFCLN